MPLEVPLQAELDLFRLHYTMLSSRSLGNGLAPKADDALTLISQRVHSCGSHPHPHPRPYRARRCRRRLLILLRYSTSFPSILTASSLKALLAHLRATVTTNADLSSNRKPLKHPPRLVAKGPRLLRPPHRPSLPIRTTSIPVEVDHARLETQSLLHSSISSSSISCVNLPSYRSRLASTVATVATLPSCAAALASS